MFDWGKTKQQLLDVARETAATDFRWSYLIVAGCVVAGVVANLLLPHGWTVWPVVLAVGLLVMVNEAADRNGQGVPPIAVYALFVGAIITWLVLVMFVSVVNPVVLMLALGVVAYQCGRGWMKSRLKKQLIDQRRAQGLCIHCGEPGDPEQQYCPSCGEVANPDGVRARWTTLNTRTVADRDRIRAALKPASPTVSARMKEQALLDRRYRPHAKRR